MAWRAIESALNAGVRSGVGDPVLYSPLAGGGPISIRAPFSSYYEEVDPTTGVAIVSQRPNLWVRNGDLPSPPLEGDSFVFESRTFRAEEVRSDGTGGTLILAREVM